MRQYIQNKNIFIYGLGMSGKKIISHLFNDNIPVKKIIDNNVQLHNTFYCGIEIVPEEYLWNNDLKDLIIFIGCNDYRAIKDKLMQKGFTDIYRDKDLFRTKLTEYNTLKFRAVEHPSVSIVITAKDDWEYTYNCIKSIYDHKTNIPFEILLGDDCSTDETMNAEKYIKGIKVCHHKKSLYYLGNCNKTIKYAKGEFIYLLGNDTIILNDYYLEKFMKEMEDEKVAAVSGKAILPCNEKEEFASAFNYDNRGNLYWIKNDVDQDVNLLLVTNMLIRKSVWEEVKGYSCDYLPAYYEDNDICMKMLNLGYRLRYQSKGTEVIHYEGVTMSQQSSNALKNKKIFEEKWHDFFSHFPSDRDLFGKLLTSAE